MKTTTGSCRALGAWLAALMLLAGCGAAAPQTPAKAPAGTAKASPAATAKATPGATLTPVTMETSFYASGSQLPFYLALVRGYYKQHGLAVKIIPGKTSALTTQQMAAGRYNVAQADLSAVALARAKGMPLEAFMAEFPRTTFGVFAAKSEGITTWRDLYGKRVLIAAGAPETYFLPATFKKLGLDYARLHIINASARNRDTDYVSGLSDAEGGDLAGANPRIQPKRPSNELFFGSVLDVLGYGCFSQPGYLKAHPQAVRAFTAATLQALAVLGKDPKAAGQAARAMLANNPSVKVPPGAYVAAWRNYEKLAKWPKGRPLGWMDPAGWAQTISVLHAYAGLKGDLNPTDYYTNQYLPKS